MSVALVSVAVPVLFVAFMAAISLLAFIISTWLDRRRSGRPAEIVGTVSP